MVKGLSRESEREQKESVLIPDADADAGFHQLGGSPHMSSADSLYCSVNRRICPSHRPARIAPPQGRDLRYMSLCLHLSYLQNRSGVKGQMRMDLRGID